MDRNKKLGILGVLFCSLCFVSATLQIKEIVAPDSVEDGSLEELLLDCDFDAQDEQDVVVKWFFNGQEEQIYQWIARSDQAYASGHLKDLIDTDYRVSNDPNTMLRALKFKEVSPALSGNYTCKVSSEESDVWLTKQIIVYSPATSFEMVLINGDEVFPGDEVILCDVTMISPKPNFELYISGVNSSIELPEMFQLNKTETLDENGFYNLSLTLPYNSSYLEEGTTKFVCELSIPGTNYSELKSVEHVVESETEPDFFYEEGSADLSLNTTSNSTEEKLSAQDSGKACLHSSWLSVVFLVLTHILAK